MRRRDLLALGTLPWLPGLSLGAAAQSQPAGRFALVIGNGAYNTNSLPNTRPDAQLIASTLDRAGFTVSLKKDLDRSTMFEAVRRFAADLPAGATALVYYAGHGMQISGNNYLLPVDITPTSEAGLAQRAFPLQALHERLALARSAVNIIILDACRNNPFQPVPAVRLRNYANLGLANSGAPRGTLVAYSTAPGQLAEDGSGRKHSIYTETLAALLPARTERRKPVPQAVGRSPAPHAGGPAAVVRVVAGGRLLLPAAAWLAPASAGHARSGTGPQQPALSRRRFDRQYRRGQLVPRHG